MANAKLSWKIRNAAREFKGKRGAFYVDIASTMQASPGVSITKIIHNYADRYPTQALGILCAHWLSRFDQVGTFSESLRGTIPDEDLTALAASEAAGDITAGLLALGSNTQTLAECKKEVWKSMISAVFLLFFMHLFVGIQAFVVMPQFESSMKAMVDLTQLGPASDVLLTGATIVRKWWLAWFLFLIAAVAVTTWAVKNYVGRWRRWLDDHILPFQIARDFNGASFFSTVACITGARGTQIVQLHDALDQVQRNSFPWLKWQIKLIKENLHSRPNSKGEIFDTGITNRKNYFRILDIADYSEMSVMLKKVGGIALVSAPEDMKRRAAKLRFTVMGIALFLMLGIYLGTYGLIDEFKAAAALKALR